MSQQQVMTQARPAQQRQQVQQPLAHPKRFDIFLHFPKTLRLIGSLIADKRIPLMQKGVFFGSILLLLVVLFFPDALGEGILSTVLPVLGTLLGVPIDASIDWMAFAMLLVNFMRVFPADIVSEHYQQIFH